MSGERAERFSSQQGRRELAQELQPFVPSEEMWALREFPVKRDFLPECREVVLRRVGALGKYGD